MRKITAGILFSLLLIICVSCTSLKILFFNYSDIDDYKIFDSHVVKNTPPAFHFKKNVSKSDLGRLLITLDNNHKVPLGDFLSSRSTKSFMVIRDDMILYEKYFNGYQRNSLVTSFSAAKSFVSALVGIALDEGYIKSINQPITDFIPELISKNGFDRITLKHLLQMTSGIRFDERYRHPTSDAARFYYDSDLGKLIQSISIEHPPGKVNSYKSVDTQLLGMAVARATGMPLSRYLQEKIWKRIGMESGASWSVDSAEKGVEKAFCCLNALTADFAKFGRLYLNKGRWNGVQVVPEQWVKDSTRIDADDGSVWWYQYHWWVDSPVSNDFSARGIGGQYIYVNPKHNIIIVRFGEGVAQRYWPGFFRKLSTHIDKIGENPGLPFFFREELFQNFF